jgi:GDP-L-fucose synthase
MDLEYYKGKRVVVLGATGLIGSYAVKLLVEVGARVEAHRGPRRDPNEFTNLAGDQPIRSDFLDPEEAEDAVEDCDVCVCCAGITGGVGLAAKDPVGYVGPATTIACNVIHACHLAKVRLGFLSSTTVYVPSDFSVREDSDTTGPPFPLYAGISYSKRFLEQLCAYYHEKVGLEVAVVRPSGAYGRFDNFDESTSHVVPGLINRARALEPRQPFDVWGDGEDVRDIVHAEDVARGLLLAIAKRPDATPFNIASGVGVTTRDLALKVLEATGKRAGLTFQRDKPTALRSRTVDISKARRELGYEPHISLEDGLKDTVEWLRSR